LREWTWRWSNLVEVEKKMSIRKPEQIEEDLRRALRAGRKHVSPQEAAILYPFSAWTFRNWAYRGLVSSIKIGGRYGRLLIPIAEIERIMAEGTRPRADVVDVA
jgi:hypothetical protein